VLKDVDYLIEAVIEVPDQSMDPNEPFPIAKYQGMFVRRAQTGQCYHRPYLGCREFPCNFEWAPEKQPVDEKGHRINESFGRMLRDFDFEPVWDCWPPGLARPASWSEHGRTISPKPTPFLAEAIDGWITVAEIRDQNGNKKVVYL
jgi:CRISPR-associated protein Cas5d